MGITIICMAHHNLTLHLPVAHHSLPIQMGCTIRDPMELCVLEWIILMQVIPDLQVLVYHLTMTVDTLNPMLRQDPTPRIVVGFLSMKVRTDQVGNIQGMNFIRMVDQGTRMGLGHTYQPGPQHMLIKVVMMPVPSHLELVVTSNGVVGFPHQPTITIPEVLVTINKVATDFHRWILEEIKCHHNMAEQIGDNHHLVEHTGGHSNHLLAEPVGGPIHQVDMVTNKAVYLITGRSFDCCTIVVFPQRFSQFSHSITIS